MKKTMKLMILMAVFASVMYMVSVMSDKQMLSDNILRLHVVGASDSSDDQAVKLMVRDAVLLELQDVTKKADNKEEALSFVEDRLIQLENAANRVLEEQGLSDRAKVTLASEEFPTRQYDTFSLPAGVYSSLRVTIGTGEGRNWWCVVYPGLCMGAASSEVADTAVGAGFSDSLSGVITGQPKYEVRFYLLDLLGRLENFFRKG